MPLVILFVGVLAAVGSTLLARRRRKAVVARYAAGADLSGVNIDGHERSNVSIAAATAYTQAQHGQSF